MVYEFSCFAKLGVYIPQLDWRFMYDAFYIMGACLYCGLIFNVKVMSVTLYTDNSVYSSPLQIPFPGCLFLKYTLSPIWKLAAGWSAVFCDFLNLFSLSVF